jgi:hypothetical protein
MKNILVFILLMFSILLFLTACYATLSGGVKQTGFELEYPILWDKSTTWQSAESIQYGIFGPDTSDNESPLKIYIAIWLDLHSQAEQYAQDIVAGRILSDSDERNFNLVKQETITLDGFSGFQVEYTHDAVADYHLPPEIWTYIPSRALNITIPRNGNVYEIWISASQNEWEARERDIQRVLETFRWD